MKPLLLIFALMLNMNSLWAAACSYPAGDSLITQQQSCDSRAGKKWDCNLNRCLNTQESVERRTDYQACATKSSDAEKKACYDSLADKFAKEDGTDLSAGGAPDSTMTSAVQGVLLGFLFFNAAGVKSIYSVCASGKVLAWGGGLALLNEIKMYLDFKDASAELQSKYEQETVNSNSYQAQLRAFEYLREGQSLIKSIAGDKQKHYEMLRNIYFIAMATAIYDLYPLAKPTCAPSGGANYTPKDYNTNALIQMVTHLEQLIFSKAYAANNQYSGTVNDTAGKDDSLKYLAALGLGAWGGYAATSALWQTKLSTPLGIMAAAGVGIVMTNDLQKAYGALESNASGNIKKLDDIITAFKNSMSQLCPNGRESLSDPRCYCTRADGSRNSDRSNSQTCQAYWAQLDRSFFVAADYYGRLSEGGRRGCVFINGQYDSNCQCKSMVDANTKQNACMKVALSGINFGSMGTAMGMQGAMDNLNSAFSGNLGLGGINLAVLSGSNARGAKIADELRNKVNADLIKQGKPPLPSSEKLMDQLINNSAIKELAKSGAASTLDPSSALLAYAPANEGAKEALKEALAKSSFIEEGGKGLKSVKHSKPNDPSFNFQSGAASGTAANQLSFEDGVMNKNYDYRENDINGDEDTPIWNIISARYLNSGLRRLFEIEGKKE